MSRQFVAQDGVIVVPASIEIDIFHYAVHAGLGFTSSISSADINGSFINLSFRTSAAASTTYHHMLFHATAVSGAQFTIYEAGTISGGTDQIPVNRRRYGTPPTSIMQGFSTASWVTNRVTASATRAGSPTIIEQFPVGAGRKEGGSGSATQELVLKDNTIYCCELADVAGAASNVAHITLDWFEVPNA